jgi:hypothetical protein
MQGSPGRIRPELGLFRLPEGKRREEGALGMEL